MGECTARRTGSVLLLPVLVLVLGALGPGGSAGELEPPWMPETLPELIRAIDLGVRQKLSPAERAAFAASTPDEFSRTYPELHEKISRSFAGWTDLWINHALQDLDDVPQARIRRAERSAAEVDARLRAYFGSRAWSYRTPSVCFLPQRLMSDPALPSISARGLYLLYYPEVLFVALDARSTLEHTLIHESLHFSKTGPDLGRVLDEGIAEAAATELALGWGLVREAALREAHHYPAELGIVEQILARMTEREPFTREQALEILLHTYLTGDSTTMDAIFGTVAWSEVVQASRTDRKIRKTVKRALGDRRLALRATLSR